MLPLITLAWAIEMSSRVVWEARKKKKKKNKLLLFFCQLLFVFEESCFGQRHSYRQVRQGLRTTKLCLWGHSHWNTGVERRRSLGQLPFSVLLFVSSPVSLGSGEELVLFGFRRQEATIPRTVEELKGKSVFGRGIKEYPSRINFIYNQGGAGLGNTRTCSGFFKPFPNPFNKI